MRTRTLARSALAAALLAPFALPALPAGLAHARSFSPFALDAPEFALIGRPLGGAQVASFTAAHLTGARLAAADGGALVIDGDSGALIKTDEAGRSVGRVAIGREAGLLTFDPAAQRVYVADRKGDRIAVVDARRMAIVSTIQTPAEPFGVALTPDRSQLLVSTIADRTLVAYDAASGREQWRTQLASEPRGIAISPDGTRALVSYLTTGTVDQIDLLGAHRAQPIAISSAAMPRTCHRCGNNGDAFARGAFAVTFLGEHQAVVPFQREVPVQQADGQERTGSYGGSAVESPITHHLAFLGFGDGRVAQSTAQIAQHQPRALAWDRARDALYVVGLGSDTIVQIKNASQASITAGVTISLTAGNTGNRRCGPDGVAVAPGGNVLVWCSFTRNLQRLELVDSEGKLASTTKATAGPELVATAMTAKQHKGFVLFHVADLRVSQRGSMACASCHPDNRADGLSWRIDKHELQTPILAGRMVGTHPFKWDGTDATLRDSLTSTMKRLGGTGLTRTETAALAAYIEALPAVRAPTRESAQVARGRKLFESQGCTACHVGPSFTDQDRHKFSGTLRESDTPSLLGLAASAPYYHDGSAATLEVLLRDRGAVHGMADTSDLSAEQIADLTAFLETL